MRKWGFWEVLESKALLNGSSAFINEVPQSCLLLKKEDAVKSLQPGRGPSLHHAGTLTLDVQPPKL